MVILRLQRTRYPYVCASIARTLGRLGADVHLLHADARGPDSRSRWLRRSVRLRRAGSEVETLLSLGSTLAPGTRPILIAVDDPAALFVDEHADVLAAAYLFPRQPAGLVRMLSDKARLHDLCRELGVPTPWVRIVDSQLALGEAASSLTYPVVLKVADPKRRRTRNVAIATSPTELRRFAQEMQAQPDTTNLLVQDYVPDGTDVAWMFNGHFGADSDLQFGGTARKLRQYPSRAGVTSLGTCEPNEHILASARHLAKATRYQGPIDIDYRYDARDDAFKILDVNPRVGTTFRLFASASGDDVVRAMYLDMLGRPLEPAAPVAGRRWIVENYDLRSALPEIARRELSVAQWIGSLRGMSEAAWFARDDLGPFAAMLFASLVDVVRLIGSRAGRAWGSLLKRLGR